MYSTKLYSNGACKGVVFLWFLGIRRFIKELEEDGKVYEQYFIEKTLRTQRNLDSSHMSRSRDDLDFIHGEGDATTENFMNDLDHDFNDGFDSGDGEKT